MAVDGQGNVLVTGTFTGSLSFGAAPPLTLTSAGLEDIFIVKLDPNGNALWAKGLGDADEQRGSAVAADATGSVYVGGMFDGTLDFPSGSVSAAAEDGIVVKFDPNGNVTWAFKLGGSSDDEVKSLSVDPSGNVVAGGLFHEKLNIAGSMVSSKGGSDAFVAKLSAGGALSWVLGFGSSKSDYVSGIAADTAGNVAMDGLFGGPIDFGCGSIGNKGPADMFVAKLDPNGACLWSKGFGDTVAQQDPIITVDKAGNVLVAEELDGVVDFGGGPLAVVGETDILVLKLDPAGNHLWSRLFGDEGDQDGRGIAVDSANNVYVVGELAGSINFGNGAFSSNDGSDDVCIAKFGP